MYANMPILSRHFNASIFYVHKIDKAMDKAINYSEHKRNRVDDDPPTSAKCIQQAIWNHPKTGPNTPNMASKREWAKGKRSGYNSLGQGAKDNRQLQYKATAYCNLQDKINKYDNRSHQRTKYKGNCLANVPVNCRYPLLKCQRQ